MKSWDVWTDGQRVWKQWSVPTVTVVGRVDQKLFEKPRKGNGEKESFLSFKNCKTNFSFLCLLPSFLIHSANPQLRPVLIIVFTHVVCPSVPTFQNLAKQHKLRQCSLQVRMWVRLAEWIIADTCLVYSFIFGKVEKSFAILYFCRNQKRRFGENWNPSEQPK